MELATKFPKPFQTADAAAMASIGNCINGSEPGTGKTAVGITLLSSLSSSRNLIVVPKSVLYQYQAEILAFAPARTTLVATGTPSARKTSYKSILSLTGYTLLLTYETLRGDMEIINHLPPFDTILFDEAHRLASHTTKTHKAIRNLLSIYRLKNHVPNIYGFTASMIMNSPMDVYGIFNILRPALFPNWYGFVSEYMVKSSQGWLVGARQNKLPKLGEIIKPYFIRRTLSEVAPELPPHSDQTVMFDLSPAETKLYNDIRKALLFEIDSKSVDKLENLSTIQNILTRMQRLQEVTDSADMLGSSGIPSTKIAVLQEKLEEVLTGNHRKCVVFTRFARMANILEQALSAWSPVKIIGEVSATDREINIKRFKSDPSCRVMVMTQAGSEGISLEEASYLIRLDTPFSIGRDIQLTGRIRRITSTEPTFSFTLCARKTIDEKIIKILANKKLMNSTIFSFADIEEMLT